MKYVKKCQNAKEKNLNGPKIGLIYAEYNCLALCVTVFFRHVTYFLLCVRIIALHHLCPCPSGVFCASHTHIVSVIQLTPSSRCTVAAIWCNTISEVKGHSHHAAGRRMQIAGVFQHVAHQLPTFIIIFDDIFSDASK